jgi:hypothetical protein
MAIAVPSLDDRDYAGLVDEARGLIPVYDPSWTNHNASDPGITLIELFAWLTEMHLYALDQITDEHRVTFLRLLNGPGLKLQRKPDDGTIDKTWLDRETAATLARLRGITRAVSARDHEVLACQVKGVKRAQCVARRNLEAGSAEDRRAVAPGHVSVVILPDDEKRTVAVCAAVRARLKPALMLTTQLHVVPPTSAPVAARLVVARRSDSPPAELAERIQQRLAAWLDAWTGGQDGDGWPFGRDVHVSELNAVLEGVRGVDYLGEVLLDSDATPSQEFAAQSVWHEAVAQPIWHDSGARVGLALAPHQLPRSSKDWHTVLVADRVEPVGITVRLTPGSADLAGVRRIVWQAVQDYLWKLQRDGHESGFELSEGRIIELLKSLPEVRAVCAIDEVSVKAELRDKSTVYAFKAGQHFHATCEIVVTGAAS